MVKNLLQCRRHRRHELDKIPWRRKWQPTPVFLAWVIPRTDEHVGLQPMESQRIRPNWAHGTSFVSWLIYTLLCWTGPRLPWWLRWQSICLQCGRPEFDPWVGKISWRRKWQPTPVFLPGESHGWRSLVGYSPWCRKESDTTDQFHSLSLHLLNRRFKIAQCLWCESEVLNNLQLHAIRLYISMYITNAMNMNLGKLREMVRDRKAWHTAVHGVAKSQTWLGDWTSTSIYKKYMPIRVIIMLDEYIWIILNTKTHGNWNGFSLSHTHRHTHTHTHTHCF